jgi:transcriptional regulator with GAF, ATPase, and Fis domain
LHPGDLVTVGNTQLRLDATRATVELPLASAERFGALVGRSAAARRLFALLATVAPLDTTVLLSGETGAGKDSCAEALHAHSRRAAGPFIVVDCAGLAEGVAESELFGHTKGAFTGANTDRDGVFVEAQGGTVFIDEIGELPRHLQPKLLRVLERREVRPVGGNEAIKVDVRVIAATNRDLKMEVNRGNFREDLFYRLNVIPIRVPPLRERQEDIPLLANLFWQRVTRDPGRQCPTRLLHSLMGRSWPGNLRELCNKIEEAALLDKREVTDGERATRVSYEEARRDAVAGFERLFLTELMREANGNIAQAARLASMDRMYLTKLLQRHGMRSSRRARSAA